MIDGSVRIGRDQGLIASRLNPMNLTVAPLEVPVQCDEFWNDDSNTTRIENIAPLVTEVQEASELFSMRPNPIQAVANTCCNWRSIECCYSSCSGSTMKRSSSCSSCCCYCWRCCCRWCGNDGT